MLPVVSGDHVRVMVADGQGLRPGDARVCRRTSDAIISAAILEDLSGYVLGDSDEDLRNLST